MEMMKREQKIAAGWLKQAMVMVVVISWLIAMASACNDYGGGLNCKDCIFRRLSYDCPPCATKLRCMAKCLWSGGTSMKKCNKRCDCNPDYPKLSDCKKCLSKCKCTCAL